MSRKTREDGMRSRQSILAFVKSFIGEKGYPPSVREIMAGTGLPSTSNVAYHLDILEADGKIKRDHYLARSIQLVESH